jgi:hypothetical protein
VRAASTVLLLPCTETSTIAQKDSLSNNLLSNVSPGLLRLKTYLHRPNLRLHLPTTSLHTHPHSNIWFRILVDRLIVKRMASGSTPMDTTLIYATRSPAELAQEAADAATKARIEANSTRSRTCRIGQRRDSCTQYSTRASHGTSCSSQRHSGTWQRAGPAILWWMAQ